MSIQANFPAIKPTLLLDFANTEALDPRITYSRASTGTYYDGKTVAKAEENLFQYSQEFNNSYWFLFDATTTANSTVAPDGTTTADSIVENTTTNFHMVYRDFALSALPYTLSAYMKANTRNFGALRIYDGVTRAAVFDLSTGVVSSTIGGVTATISSVGNGWYRCTMLLPVANAAVSSIGVCTSETGTFVNYLGNGSSIFIWGAQLEQRSFATAYTPTTTAPITNYIPVLQTAASGVPRFEHNPVTGESLGLEIEEQRTNLLTYSEQFDNAAWSAFGTKTISSNTLIAPDGTLTAEYLSSPGNNGIQQTVNCSASTQYTLSVFAKAGAGNDIQLSFASSGGTGASGNNGSILISSGASVGNGWFRLTYTIATAAGDNLLVVRVQSANNANPKGIYVWGAQLEAGAFPTSYIPTVASQVTRAADSASMTGTNFSSWYNQSEGTVLADYAIGYLPSGSMLPRIASINDGSTANCVDLFINAFWPRTAGLVRTNSTSVVDTNIGSNLTATTSEKSIIGYKINDFALTKNGLAAVNDTDGVVPQVVNRLQIGANSESRSVNGTIKKLAYYPRRLTNTQLQALTS